jgi:hypothetical protein
MEFENIVVSAFRGLTDEEVYELLLHLDLSTVRDQPEGAGELVAGEAGADGVTIEQFDLQRSQARQRIVEEIDSIARHRVAEQHIPGSKCRNIHVAVVLRKLATRRLAFPDYVLAYRYKGELYRAVVCGQNAACVRGSAPYSMAKMVLAPALGLAVLGVAVAAILASPP